MWGVLLAAIASFGLLLAVFVPLERLFPARARQPVLRRELATDACFFFGQYLLFSGVAAALLAVIQRVTGSFAPAPIVALFARLPIWIALVIGVVLGDVLVYWFHRACHRFELLWRFHKVHHSTEQLDWLAAHREHPLDGFFTQLCQNLPLFVLGLPIELLAALAVFRGMWGVFIHSNVQLSLGPLAYLLGAPELHHFHHARLGRTEHNFANLAPWIDVVFGTFHRPAPGPETYPLGLTEPWPRSYLGQLAQPFLPTISSSSLARASIASSRPLSTHSGSNSEPTNPSANAPAAR